MTIYYLYIENKFNEMPYNWFTVSGSNFQKRKPPKHRLVAWNAEQDPYNLG